MKISKARGNLGRRIQNELKLQKLEAIRGYPFQNRRLLDERKKTIRRVEG
jgi:hypothetical protein